MKCESCPWGNNKRAEACRACYASLSINYNEAVKTNQILSSALTRVFGILLAPMNDNRKMEKLTALMKEEVK